MRHLTPNRPQWLLENGKSNAGYHYMGSAMFFAQLGEAFAKKMLQPQM